MADVISLEDLAFLALYHTIIDYLAEIPANHKREQFLSDDQPGLNPRAQANAFQKVRTLSTSFTLNTIPQLFSYLAYFQRWTTEKSQAFFYWYKWISWVLHLTV